MDCSTNLCSSKVNPSNKRIWSEHLLSCLRGFIHTLLILVASMMGQTSFASSGTIVFSGAITESTCTINANQKMSTCAPSVSAQTKVVKEQLPPVASSQLWHGSVNYHASGKKMIPRTRINVTYN